MTGYKDAASFGAKDIAMFFGAIDRHLTERVRIVVIGGAAAALHDARSTTHDIDTNSTLPDALRAAIAAAVAETGLDIPVGLSSIADFPYGYEDRLERRLPKLEHLEVQVLERYDLALSKTMRGSDHDEEQLLEVHRAHPFDFDTLVDRYQSDFIKYVVGDPARIRAQFLQLVEVLFGPLKRVAAEKALS